MPATAPGYDRWAGLGILLLLSLTGCGSGDTTVAPTGTANEPPPPTPTASEPLPPPCGDGGELQTELYGAIAGRISWGHADIQCSGMRRPEGRGARLRFAGPFEPGDRRLALIIAIPGLERGLTGDEYESNVTLMEEGSGRFFSTASLGNCLTNVTRVDALDESGDRFAISGKLYCVAPLAEVNGAASVSISDLHFSGLLDWSAT